MQLHIHLKKDYLALRFASTADRDTFFAEMGKNPVNGYYIQNAAQRVGNRTIQISPSKVEFSHEWPVQFLSKRIKEIGDSVPIRVNTPAAAVVAPKPPTDPNPPTVFPPAAAQYAPEAQSPQSVVVKTQPAPVFPEIKSPIDPIVAVPLDNAPAPVDNSDPKPVGVHHLSKEMREWKARQKSKQPVAA